MITIEDELAGVRVLAQLTILEELDGQVVRVDLRLHIRPQRRERVVGLATRPLTFRILYRPVADVLRGGVTENVPRGRRRGDIADATAHHDGQLRFVIGAMVRKGDFDLPPVRQQGRRRLQPEQRLLGDRFAGLARVVGVVQAHRDHFRRIHRGKRFDSLQRNRLLFVGGGSKHIALQAEKFAVDYFSVKDFVAFLEPPDSCHKWGFI